MAEEENLILQGSSSMERGRRAPKEEPKLDDVRVCVCVCVKPKFGGDDILYILLTKCPFHRLTAPPMTAFQSWRGRSIS